MKTRILNLRRALRRQDEYQPGEDSRVSIAAVMGVALQVDTVFSAAGALLWATLIGLSTLYTKQHYVLDVIAGVLVAYAAYLLFLRPHDREAVSASDRSASSGSLR